MSAITDFDVGPLTWVKGEIDQALNQAREKLAQYAENAADTSQLRFCLTHLHQVSGAVQMVGLEGVARISQEIENLVSALEKQEIAEAPAAVDVVLRAIDGLAKYLDDLISGEPDQALRLFPLYKELLQARKAERIAESDLFFPDLGVRAPKNADAKPLSGDELSALVKKARAKFQRGLLGWLKQDNPEQALILMRESVAAIENAQAQPANRTFWWVTSALIDSLIHQGIGADLAVKQVCARVDLQMRRLAEGSQKVAERLLRDVLYLVARSGKAGPRLDEVVKIFELKDYVPAATVQQEGPDLQPILRSCRDLLASAKEAWLKVASGKKDSLKSFNEQAGKLGEKIQGLNHPALSQLMSQIMTAAADIGGLDDARQEMAYLEMATSLLLVENAVESFERLGEEFERQSMVQSKRLQAAVYGNVDLSEVPNIPLLDEMSRRAQEKLLFAQVAHEINTNLGNVEQVLDSFFRDPNKRGDIPAIEPAINQVLGALRMLELERAYDLLKGCQQLISDFAKPEYTATQEQMELVADGLSSLGFYVDAIQYGRSNSFEVILPVLKRFPDFKGRAFEAEEAVAQQPEEQEAVPEASVEASLEERMREAQSRLNEWQQGEGGEAGKQSLRETLSALRQDADLMADEALKERATTALGLLDQAGSASDTSLAASINSLAEPKAQVTPSEESVRLAAETDEAVDAELLETYLEEAVEVLARVKEHLDMCRHAPHDNEAMTVIRRGFHTLKGSGRMVGLTTLGEVAWEVEQTMNKWLSEERAATPDLIELIGLAHDSFEQWVGELQASGVANVEASKLVAMATMLRTGKEPVPAQETATGAEEAGVSPEPEEMQEVETAAPEAAAADILPADTGAEAQAEEITQMEEPSAIEEAPMAEQVLEPLEAETVQEAMAAEESAAPPELEIQEAEPIAPETGVTETFQAEPVEETQAEQIHLMEEAPAIEEGPTAEPTAELPEAAPEAEIGQPALDLPELVEVPAEAEEPELVAIEPALPATEEETLGESLLEAAFAAEAPEDIVIEVETAEEIAPEIPAPQMISEEEHPPELKVEEAEAAAPVETEIEIGGIVISPALFQIFLDEAERHLASLNAQFSRLSQELAEPVQHDFMRAAHTLGGIASTTGFESLAELGYELEQWLSDVLEHPLTFNDKQIKVTGDAIERLGRMVAEIRERKLPKPAKQLMRSLQALVNRARAERQRQQADEEQQAREQVAAAEETMPVAEPLPPAEASTEAVPPEAESILPEAVEERAERRAIRDDLDEQLLPIFLEEASELFPQISAQLREWRASPKDQPIQHSLQRSLHTLKGSARMAGAMRLGELTHQMEARVIDALEAADLPPELFDELEAGFDRLADALDYLQRGEAMPEAALAPAPKGIAIEPAALPAAAQQKLALPAEGEQAAQQKAQVRVRADTIDRLVNEAGEVSIARSRAEGEMLAFKQGLLDLTENVIRLRNQLREIEIQAESQMQSRMSHMQEDDGAFDPLEFDRFTRFQELTRMMAESVNDVATVQQNLLKNLDEAEAALLAQGRMTKELQQELMRIRMVPMSSVSERLYRIVRQAAKETGKKANLDIRGAQVEIDRGVLEKMTAPFEHLLRNAIAHGLEDKAQRLAANKPEFGQIQLEARQEGNEVVLVFSDDGVGLNLDAIRKKAIAQGLLDASADIAPAALMEMIFVPGFSTAKEVTQLSGRGIGMDVVRNEITSLGGRIEVDSQPGRGTTFTVKLPLTLAVTQAVLINVAGQTYALPSGMIEQVQELKPDALAKAYEAADVEWMGKHYPFAYLPRLLGDQETVVPQQRYNSVILLRSGTQYAAIHVDELVGNREVVVKNIGPQLARVPGITGATVLGDGRVVMILNPVLLAHRGQAPVSASEAPAPTVLEEAPLAPLIMVVDDSLTVRKITSRLLSREGYQVVTAKDGIDALQQMQEFLPEVMLVDIEMPRMDGFELTKNVRGDAKTKHIPIIMITSRTAEKHRNYAQELGVNAYLGKPYQEEELLGLIADFVKRDK